MKLDISSTAPRLGPAGRADSYSARDRGLGAPGLVERPRRPGRPALSIRGRRPRFPPVRRGSVRCERGSQRMAAAHRSQWPSRPGSAAGDGQAHAGTAGTIGSALPATICRLGNPPHVHRRAIRARSGRRRRRPSAHPRYAQAMTRSTRAWLEGARRRLDPAPRKMAAAASAAALAVVLAGLRQHGIPVVTFDPASACTTDGRQPGAYPELEALLPNGVRRQGARHAWTRAATARRGPRHARRRRASPAWSSPGATWELGGTTGLTVAVFQGKGLDPKELFTFYRDSGGTDRHTEKMSTSDVTVGGQAARRLDMLASDGTGQTVVVWPVERAGHGVRAARGRRRRRGRARRAGPVRRDLNARVAAMSDGPDDWEARRRALAGGARRALARPPAGAASALRDARRPAGGGPVRPWDWVATPGRRARRARAARPPSTTTGDPLRDGAGRYADMDPLRDIGPARRAALHPRHPPDGLPVAAVDDAHVRRLRRGRGHERPLPPAARRRPDGPLDRLRHADAVRLRHRRPGGRGRVRHVRRGGQQPRPTWRSCSTACRSTASARR